MFMRLHTSESDRPRAGRRVFIGRALLGLLLTVGVSLLVLSCGSGGSGGGTGDNGDPALVITAIPDQEVAIGNSLDIPVEVTGGPTSGTVMYRVEPKMARGATLAIGESSGLLTINASTATATDDPIPITVTATKGSKMDTESFRLTIGPLSIDEILDQEVVAGESLEIQVVVSGGRDSDTTSYSVAPPAVNGATLAIGESSGMLTINASSGTATASPATITVTAMKGTEMDTETFDLTIRPALAIEPITPKTVGAGESATVQVATSGGPTAGMVRYEVTGSTLVSIDTAGLLTIDASRETMAAAEAVTIMVTAMKGPVTATASFQLTISDPVLTIRLNNTSGTQTDSCTLVEGDISTAHSIVITGPPGGTAINLRFETSGGIMAGQGEIDNATGFQYTVGATFTGTINVGNLQTNVTIRALDDSPNTEGEETLTLTILPGTGYRLPTMPGMGYEISSGNVVVMCTIQDPSS